MEHDTASECAPKNAAGNVSYSPSLMACVSILPLRDYATDVTSIVRRNGRVTLTVKPGKDDKWAYGKIPRLFILYLQTLITTHSDSVDPETRTVLIDDNFSELCRKMGIRPHGGCDKEVVRQILRLSQTSFNVNVNNSDGEEDYIEDAKMFFFADECHVEFKAYKRNHSYIKLSERMWALLSRSSMPVSFDTVTDLGKSARAIDVYLWLTYRMNSMPGNGIHITWEQLRDQFDDADVDMANFRKKFRQAVECIREKWPELKIETDRHGVHVWKGSPSVPHKPCVNTGSSTVQVKMRSNPVYDGSFNADADGAYSPWEDRTTSGFGKGYTQQSRPEITEGFISRVITRVGYDAANPIGQRRKILALCKQGLEFNEICEELSSATKAN